uniref:Uncharacterized protein n=2 Tax=Graphocephala atropunctata TaxID=36148 RepID=A0A1B6MQV6_9HEMI
MIVKTIAWMLRLSPKNKVKSEADISSEEFKTAEKTLLRLIQEESFHNDLKCKALCGINTYIDEDGITRLKSRPGADPGGGHRGQLPPPSAETKEKKERKEKNLKITQ